MIKFIPLNQFKQGLLFDLLSKSYSDFPYKDKYLNDWKKYDKEAFSNPKIGECIFITCLDDKPIGFASYDPRQGPERAIIGHNCILPEYWGRGYGKKQIEELIRLFKRQYFKKALVKTADHSFFLNAKKLYLSCGFKEIKRFTDDRQGFPVIEYGMDL